ncbi:RseA family anti-sigma factor [Halomonas piscis]|uniref:RseA family anti-sigma factor n=1 Tax=Halomonas piscis TaxID=3031727 RepID=A0ABY9Z474_9GAMM|nr:RseA family anti-sigma factor [Halomonas piscis]WNK21490.1 RseA family anti-sigma factor [Halomonas piscis]
MSQDTREALSALMDGEGDELELRRVLKTLPEDTGAADAWRRYHLARSLMQRDHGVDTSADLSAGVMARLQDEPVPVAEAPTAAAPAARASSRVSLMRGAGVAAAVSLMVITGVQYFGSTSSNTADSPELAGEPVASSDDGAQAIPQPVSLAASESGGSTPMFEPTPFQLNRESRRQGLMTVSDGGSLAPSAGQAGASRAAMQVDSEQIHLLQSYLQEHAHGAAYSNSDSWLPLSRSSAMSDALGR